MIDLLVQRLQELGLTPETIALARGMLLGDKSVVDPALVQQFRAAGMSHLLAVSGLHVGIIMSLVWLLLRPVEALINLMTKQTMRVYYAVGFAKRLCVILITIVYVLIIGSPPSAVRAALMLCLCLVGWMLHRPTSPWHCLLLTALVLIAIDPWNITQVGFQLSFLAVAGILLFSPWLQDRAIPRWLRLILLSIAAQSLSVPFVAYYFHQVPVLGWLQGLLVVPLVPFFVGGLLLGAFIPSWHWLCLPIELFRSWASWVAQFITKSEHLLLQGHLYFYPSWFEVFMCEVIILVVILYLRRLKAASDNDSQ